VSKSARTLVCFDFGSKRIGVAVGQELTGSATALETISTTNGQPDWSAINRIVQQWRPQAFVLGMPVNMDGSEHDLAKSVQRFSDNLQTRYHLPVYTMDERLSSVEAERILGAETKTTKRINKKEVDKLAAKLILQSWFEHTLTE
jgi:putative Holliday junction resolvase